MHSYSAKGLPLCSRVSPPPLPYFFLLSLTSFHAGDEAERGAEGKERKKMLYYAVLDPQMYVPSLCRLDGTGSARARYGPPIYTYTHTYIHVYICIWLEPSRRGLAWGERAGEENDEVSFHFWFISPCDPSAALYAFICLNFFWRSFFLHAALVLYIFASVFVCVCLWFLDYLLLVGSSGAGHTVHRVFCVHYLVSAGCQALIPERGQTSMHVLYIRVWVNRLKLPSHWHSLPAARLPGGCRLDKFRGSSEARCIR